MLVAFSTLLIAGCTQQAPVVTPTPTLEITALPTAVPTVPSQINQTVADLTNKTEQKVANLTEKAEGTVANLTVPV